MMERNFYNDEFEELIREKTDQYKMYPSEKVWKGIHGSLHTKRRWFIGVMSVLITGTIFIAGKELILPSSHPAFLKKLAVNTANPAKTGEEIKATEEKEDNLSAALSSFKTPSSHPHKARANAAAGEDPQNDKETAIHGEDEAVTTSRPVAAEQSYHKPFFEVITARPPAAAPLSAQAILPSSVVNGGGIENDISNNTRKQAPIPAEVASSGSAAPSAGSAKPITYTSPVSAGRPVTTSGSLTKSEAAAGTLLTNPETSQPALAEKSRVAGSGSAEMADNQPETVSLSPANPAAVIPASSSPANPQAGSGKTAGYGNVNWLEEYALYELIPAARKKSRRGLQFYFSPTVNYRKLSGDDNINSKTDVQNIPISLVHDGKVNDFVNHKPAMGFEVGGNLLYRASRNLTLKAGLQFNYIQYTIKAYAASNPERATIGLNSAYGYYTDSITSYTSIRNFGGRTPTTLSNQYYQLSVPVGFELRIMGNERLQLNIAGTIQPTYLLNRNSYLLTTDYTNYTKEPSLFRRWNLNGGAEVFLSYKIGGMRWQIGPEFRYQLLSTYSSQYPIHENLREYGLKIGVSKTIR